MSANQTEKFSAIEKDINGLQQLARSNNEQFNQTMSLLGQMRMQLDAEQARVKTLTMQMEQVYTYINKNRI